MKNKNFTNMKIRIVFSVLATLVATACSGPRQSDSLEYEPPHFKAEHKADIVALNKDILLGNVAEMFLCDSVAVLYARNRDNDNSMQVVSVRTGEFVRGFANSGRGEGELMTFHRAAISPDGRKMYAIDHNSKLVSFDLGKVFSGERQYVDRSEYFGGRNTTMSLQCLADNTFLHIEGWPDRHFTTDSYFADTLVRYKGYPVISKAMAESPDTLMTEMYFKNHLKAAVKPDRSKFVETAYYGFIMQIFDLGTDAMKPSATCRFYEPKMKNYIACTDDCIAGPVDIATSDNYIYVVYAVEPEMSAESLRMGVFDWNGNAVECYRFDRTVSQIAVTPDDKRVYCWVQDRDGEEYLGYIDLTH